MRIRYGQFLQSHRSHLDAAANFQRAREMNPRDGRAWIGSAETKFDLLIKAGAVVTEEEIREIAGIFETGLELGGESVELRQRIIGTVTAHERVCARTQSGLSDSPSSKEQGNMDYCGYLLVLTCWLALFSPRLAQLLLPRMKKIKDICLRSIPLLSAELLHLIVSSCTKMTSLEIKVILHRLFNSPILTFIFSPVQASQTIP